MVEDLASTAAMANASGGTRVASPKAAHMATTAYGVQAPRKPIHTAIDSYREKNISTRKHSTKTGQAEDLVSVIMY